MYTYVHIYVRVCTAKYKMKFKYSNEGMHSGNCKVYFAIERASLEYRQGINKRCSACAVICTSKQYNTESKN